LAIVVEASLITQEARAARPAGLDKRRDVTNLSVRDIAPEVLMSFRYALTVALAAASLSGLGARSALANSPSRSSCFLSSNWGNWKSPDPSTLYLRVTTNRIFRLDLSHPSYRLNDPSVHLVSEVRGSSWICSPLDLQPLYVADNHGGIREPLFVSRMTELTPQQVAAIPPKYRP